MSKRQTSRQISLGTPMMPKPPVMMPSKGVLQTNMQRMPMEVPTAKPKARKTKPR